MSYANVAEIVAETVERLVAEAGVSRAVAEAEMKGVEWAVVQDLAQTQRDNQLLLCFDEHGSQACAERWGVSPRTIRERRKEALDRKQRRHMAAA
jgi:hypothetical protein